MKVSARLAAEMPPNVKKVFLEELREEREKVRDAICAHTDHDKTNVLRGRASTLTMLIESLSK